MGARAGDSTQLPDLCVLRSPSCSVPLRWSYSGPPRLSGEGTHWQASWSCTTCHPASHMTGEASPPIQCSASISQSRGKGAALCLVGNWGPCSDLRHWDRNAVPRLPPPTQSRNSGSASCLFGGPGVGVLTFILIFTLIFGSCHLLANTYVQVTAFYM